MYEKPLGLGEDRSGWARVQRLRRVQIRVPGGGHFLRPPGRDCYVSPSLPTDVILAGGLHGSMTRKLMSVLDDPEIISLGGGLPAWDLFPIDAIRQVVDDLLRTDGPATLQ